MSGPEYSEYAQITPFGPDYLLSVRYGYFYYVPTLSSIDAYLTYLRGVLHPESNLTEITRAQWARDRDHLLERWQYLRLIGNDDEQAS